MSADVVVRPLSILLVEDYAIDAFLLVEMLEQAAPEERPSVKHVTTVTEAEQELLTLSYDCVLLDLGLPDGEGVENVQRVRAASSHVAIVVMTGLDDEDRAIEALRLGAQEYLVKGRLNSMQLLRHVHHAIQRHGLLAHLDRENQQQKLLAGHDLLTGLVNRQLLHERARDAMAQARRVNGRLAFCFLDLDGFKAVNDRHGHAIGDAALVAVADALRSAVRAGDIIARIGGDEFVVMQVAVRDESDVRETGTRLVSAVRAITHVEGRGIRMGASAGAAIFPDHGDSLEQLLLHADELMYRVKREGGGEVRVRPAGKLAPQVLSTVSAVPVEDAGLVYQPWAGGRGAVAGVEALLRQRRDGKWGSPEELLRTSEELGERSNLWQWVLRTACGHWSRWHHLGPVSGRLAVNMSAVEVAVEGFPQALAAVLDGESLPHGTLQIEIAEHLLDNPPKALIDNLVGLRAIGVRVVLDKFGRDLASLRLLTGLPIDGVKLDASVVRGLSGDGPSQRALVAGIMAAAQVCKLEVVAVGVEQEKEAQACIDLSCDALQGLWYAGWVGAEDLPELVAGRAQRERQIWLNDPARRGTSR